MVYTAVREVEQPIDAQLEEWPVCSALPERRTFNEAGGELFE
jgi:hypothetical protein